jgi:hypothetical protein
MKWYILEDKKPVETKDMQAWGEFMQNDERIVYKTNVGDVNISTVFLGLDHNMQLFDGSMKNYQPILFETMIFGGERDQYQERYATWEEAEDGHTFAVSLVKETIK